MLDEVQRFLRAALVTPVSPDRPVDPRGLGRRRVVVAVTLVIGSALLVGTLRAAPGSAAFYGVGLALAACWALGALASGPVPLGRAATRRGDSTSAGVVQAVVLGVALLALFLVGAVVVARVPVLAGPVDGLLDKARLGSLPLVAAVTAVNGLAEEMFFRGALFAALPRRWAIQVSTLVYALTTIGGGVPLLVLAAVLLGLLTGAQRRVTGGVLGPVITHLTWSLGMLLLLPRVLDLVR